MPGHDSDAALPLPVTVSESSNYGSAERQFHFAEVDRITNSSQPGALEPEPESKRPFLLRWVPVVHPHWLLITMLFLTLVQLSRKVRDEVSDDIVWDLSTFMWLGVVMPVLCAILIWILCKWNDCCCGVFKLIVVLIPIYYGFIYGGKYMMVFFESIGPALAWPPNLVIAVWKMLMNEAGASKYLPPTYSDWRVAAYGGLMYYFWLSSLVFGQQIIALRAYGCCTEVSLRLLISTPAFLVIGALYTNRMIGELVKYLCHMAMILHSNKSNLGFFDWITLVVLLWWLLLPYPTFERLGFLWKIAEQHEQLFNEALEQPYYATLETASTRKIFRALSTKFMDEDNEDAEAGLRLHRTISETTTKRDALVKELQEYHRASFGTGADGKRSAKMLSSVQLIICRTKLLEASLNAIGEAAPQQLALSSQGNFAVHFEGEAGIDAGGLKRDWFESVAQALLRGTEDAKGTSLLTLAPDKTLMPRSCLSGLPGATKLRELHEKHDPEEKELRQRLKDLMHAGRFVALAVVHVQPIPICLGTAILKCLLKIPIHFSDVRQLDPEFYRNRVQLVLKEGGVNELNQALGEPLTFMSAPTEAAPESTALVESGESTLVSEENKLEYVMLLCEAYLCGSIRTEMQMFLRGFWEVLPHAVLAKSGVNYRELAILIAGVQEIDVVQWRTHTKFDATNATLIQWLFEVLAEFTNDQRSMFLQFATGSSRLPPGGFAALQPVFKVDCVDEPLDHLPHSHTCFNQLMLPRYLSKNQLKDKLMKVIALNGDMGFGFA